MKNLKRFNQLNEEENPEHEFEKEQTREGLKLFNEACEKYDFYGAFVVAQEQGLFDGDFDEYIESRKKAGSAYDKMIKLHAEWQKISAELKDLIVADVEDAQGEYGHK